MPTPISVRMSRPKLKAPVWTSSRLRMLGCPRRCVGDWRTPRLAPWPCASSAVGRDGVRQCTCAGPAPPDPPRPGCCGTPFGDDFLDHAGVLVCRRGHSFEFLGGRRHRVRDGRGIPLVGALDRHPDDGAGLQVDRVLGLVREVRAAVLHLRDARVGVVRMPPVGVAALLRAVRSNRARSARVGVAMPDACASRVKTPNRSRPSRVARCSAGRRSPPGSWHQCRSSCP